MYHSLAAIDSGAPHIIVQPWSRAALLGQSVSLSARAVGSGPLFYQWTFNGANLNGATNSVLAFGNVTSGDAGNYAVVVTNACGSVTSQVAVLTANQLAQTITFTDALDKTYGDPPFTLMATASSGLAVSYASDNTAVATVSGNTVTIVGTGTAVITASQAGDANYLPAANVTQTLTVNGAASLTLTVGTNSGVQGAQVVVPVTVSQFQQVATFQFSLHWDPAVITFISLEQYGVPGLASGNFNTGQSSSGSITVSWDDPDGANKTLADGATLFALRFSLTASAGATSRVWIDGTPSLIEATDADVNPIPVATVEGWVRVLRVYSLQTEVVGAGQIQLSPTGGSYVEGTIVTAQAIASPGSRFVGWEGDLSGTTPSQTVTMTSAKSIRARFAVSIQITQAPESQTTFTGGNSVFMAAATSAEALSCQWLFNGVAISGATQTALVLSNVQSAQAGTYALVVANLYTSVTSAPATLTVVSPGSVLTLDVGSVTGLLSGEVVVPIRVSHFQEMASLQFSLHWDTTIGTWVGVEQFGVAGLASGNFGTTEVGNGTVTVSWDDPDAIGKTLADGTTLFGLRLRLVGARGSAGWAWIDSQPTVLEALNAVPAAVPVAICAGRIQVRSTVSISGTVTYYDPAKVVPGVKLYLTEGMTGSTVSGSDGAYSFGNVPAGANYVVTPGKTNDNAPAQGVTTADISLLRRHVLNILPLDSGYKLLAADVNGSDSATTADITLMRRVILNITTNFPAGLWRFVPADYTFATPQAPWGAPTNRSYTGLAADAASQNFVAIKLGDVNNSWTLPAGWTSKAVFGKTPAALGLGEPVGFQASSPTIKVGETGKVAITVSGFSLVTSVQFTLQWDTNVLRYLSTGDYGLAGVAGGNFGTTLTNSGKLTFSWDDPEALGVTKDNGTTVFTVSFVAKTNKAKTSCAVTLMDVPTVREVTVNFDPAPFQATDGLVSVSYAPLPTNPSLAAQVNQSISFPAAKLATDANGDNLTFGVSTPSVQGGTVTLAAGVVTYSPRADFTGVDSFDYTVSDGPSGLIHGTVTVTVSEGAGGRLNVLVAPAASEGQFTFRFAGVPGWSYTIEWSGDPNGPWQKKSNVTIPTTDQGWGIGVYEFSEPTGGAPQRYYRTVFPAY
jgi:hypothetical protein